MKNILFLCTGNSCRSQMAEGFARKLLGSQYSIYSAGTKKHGMNQKAIKVMAEVGIDLSTHYSKALDELEEKNFHFVVTVCGHANENCPYFPGGKIIHHGFDDPPSLTADMADEDEILIVYRRVRDEISEYIKKLKIELE